MKRLLLVDDSALFVRVLKMILSKEYEVVGTAHDAKGGIEAFESLKPDIVLLDVTMPDVNGKDCLRKILSIDASAKVIMVSSLGDDATVSECLKIGACAFVPKSRISVVDVDGGKLLLDTIEIALSQCHQEAA